jgi:RimJ/RimL family protein N-acetyltransferase
MPRDLVPELTTSRLVLRAHRADDFPACAAMWADHEVVRFIGGVPRSAQEAWFAMLRYSGTWGLLGFGYWTITDRETGTFLGEGGFGDFRRGISELDGVPEMGWALVLAWSDAHTDADEVRCMIAPENAASIRVAEKAGFVQFADVEESIGRSLVFRRSKRTRG